MSQFVNFNPFIVHCTFKELHHFRLTGEDQLFSKARLLASFTAAAINLIFIVTLNKVGFDSACAGGGGLGGHNFPLEGPTPHNEDPPPHKGRNR